MNGLIEAARVVRYSHPWKAGHYDFLLKQFYHRGRNREQAYSDSDHLLAAAQWLEAAQDVTGDGGVSGRYVLHKGWSSSYPETTGYIIPTFLALSEALGEQRFAHRARKCFEFLLPLQLDSGAFPGGEVARNKTEPSPFNTAQIINGLVAWHRASGEDRALRAARRAGDWLLSVQDEDGAFRKHYHHGIAATYSAHLSCWLAELGEHVGDERYLAAARRHLEWTLKHFDAKTGWFDNCGFTTEDHRLRRSVTHTIAYTLWGVLFTSAILRRDDGVQAVRKAAEGIARRLELSRWLPGVLDNKWKPCAGFACLTGNAQMALIWMRLHEIEPNLRFVNAALKAIDCVKAAQHVANSNSAIRGGIAGSDPVWGAYIKYGIPNWAAKFFIDALLEKQQMLVRLQNGDNREQQADPIDVPTTLPATKGGALPAKVKVVMITTRGKPKPSRMLTSWKSLGVRPDVIVMQERPSKPAWKRVRERLQQDGLAPLLSRFWQRSGAQEPAGDGDRESRDASLPKIEDLARELEIPIVHVQELATPEGLEVLRSLQPDVFVYAGAGILRDSLLRIARLGTLNAHLGLLPRYRGMNATEWAALHEDPAGCSVHLIDSGIDTGDILCVRQVDGSGAADIAELRDRVDQGQMMLLGEVLQYIVQTGELPPRRVQTADEGRQYFPMHEDFRARLQQMLRAGGKRGA